MRGELFGENEIIESDDFFREDEEQNEYADYKEKLNPLLSSDIIELQKQHMIILEYVKELESRNINLKERIERLEREIMYYEKKEEGKIFRTNNL